MGTGIGSIESAIDDLFHAATDEITLTIYTISTGADFIFRLLESALARGIQITLVINHLDEQPVDVVDCRLSAIMGHRMG